MLPAGCKRVAWIASTGTQYVNTGFVPKGTTRVVMDFEFPTTPSTTYTAPWVLFGARASAASNNYTFMSGASSSDSSDKYFRSDYNGTYTQEWHITQTGRKTVDKNANATTINGTTQTYPSANFTAPVNLVLFALNNNGTVQWKSSMRLYACQIYDNGTLVRDYIPCIDEAGDATLWDDVNGAFAEKVGTFTAGPIVEPPSAPESVRTALSVCLRWNASTGAGSYNIYRDGILIGTTTAAQFVDTAAEENETYTYAVSAVGIGGESARTEITVYTRTGYFQYKPYIQSANFQ